MSTWKLAPAIAILSLVGCGPPAQEVEAPPLPDPETAEPAAETPTEDDAESGDSESGDTDSDDSASDETQPRLPPHEVKKSCKGLSESTCKVTEGCAWSTTEDCIEQEAEP
jgi:hypothetical protein